MDGPVGAGFSYSESLDAYYSDDYQFAAQTHEFLRKVCKKVDTNRIYLAKKMLFLIRFYPVINSKIYSICSGWNCTLNFWKIKSILVVTRILAYLFQ